MTVNIYCIICYYTLYIFLGNAQEDGLSAMCLYLNTTVNLIITTIIIIDVLFYSFILYSVANKYF